MSTKRERFEKVAANRVDKILHYLDLLGNCSNINNYEYSEIDVEKMFTVISKTLKASKMLYDKQLSKTKENGFKF